MEAVKYVLDFFFNDFWHYIMLVLLCLALCPKPNISNHMFHRDANND